MGGVAQGVVQSSTEEADSLPLCPYSLPGEKWCSCCHGAHYSPKYTQYLSITFYQYKATHAIPTYYCNDCLCQQTEMDKAAQSIRAL